MSPLLLAATLTITLAFFAYTFGVFSERRAGTLKKGHLSLFWLGLAFDTTGTTIMSVIASGGDGSMSPLHAITGVVAIALMFFHALWATRVVLRGDEAARESFHRLSICVCGSSGSCPTWLACSWVSRPCTSVILPPAPRQSPAFLTWASCCASRPTSPVARLQQSKTNKNRHPLFKTRISRLPWGAGFSVPARRDRLGKEQQENQPVVLAVSQSWPWYGKILRTIAFGNRGVRHLVWPARRPDPSS